MRCDGLAVCTPAGSTGYNLANGGPVLAWGVEGFCVSFIAPHSLTARALVVAPADTLTVSNHGREAVDVFVDGRPVCEIAPGEDINARFEPGGDGAGAAARLVVLQAPAGEVRAPELVTKQPQRGDLSGAAATPWRCSASCASRTSCSSSAPSCGSRAASTS